MKKVNKHNHGILYLWKMKKKDKLLRKLRKGSRKQNGRLGLGGRNGCWCPMFFSLVKKFGSKNGLLMIVYMSDIYLLNFKN